MGTRKASNPEVPALGEASDFEKSTVALMEQIRSLGAALRNPGTQEFLDFAWLHQGYTQATTSGHLPRHLIAL